jgi:hypothetical protein
MGRLISELSRASRLPSGVSLIGEGHVGGKAAGIIFVKERMERAPLTPYDDLIIFPESTVLTTAVFDEFILKNRLTEAVEAKCRRELSFEELTEEFLAADLPQWTIQQLRAFLEKEQRPLVVRSSSLMEDDPHHSFAGIYLSEFLPNTGDLEERLDALASSIKRVYASTFGENARAYRKRYGLPWEREKMAVLIQNMVGSHYPGNLFYPLVSGVAFSRNFYPWTERLKQEDGLARLVIGVGTRAVGRAYARVFSPKLPGLRPEGTEPQEIIRYAQEIVDVLDMAQGSLSSVPLGSLENPHFPKVLAVAREDGTLVDYTWAPKGGERCIALFDRLVETDRYAPLTPILRSLLAELEKLFGKPVDIEFALDFVGKDRLAEVVPSPSAREVIERRFPNRDEVGLFYLLQARHLGCREEHRRITIPDLPPERILLECHNVLGNGYQRRIKHLILVDPERYRFDRGYEVARKVGKLDQLLDDERYILMGPGRWATSNPQLGVPVRYSEITNAAVIVEMASERFSPELSYGTHFYADMVASGILYLSYDAKRGDQFNRRILKSHLTEHSDADVLHLYFEKGLDVYVDGQERRGVIVVG